MPPENRSGTGNLRIRYLSEEAAGAHAPDSPGQDIVRGLTSSPKSLPSKYFYDRRGSRLFEEICKLPEYYLTRTEASILRRYAGEIADTTGACELVELGSGNSGKTRLLLDAYSAGNYGCRYVAVDIDENILMSTAVRLRQDYPGLGTEVRVGTYEQALACSLPKSMPARMILFLGSSVGNMTEPESDRFFHRVRRALSAGDYFLLGVDLQKSGSVLEAAYNDAQGVSATFNLNMLSHINRRFKADFDPALFLRQAIYDGEKQQVDVYFCCNRDHTVRIEALDFQVDLKRGERILVQISRKFDIGCLRRQLESHHFNVLQVYTDPRAWFGLLLCQAAG